MRELCKLQTLHVFPLVALKVLQQFGATVGFGLSENKKNWLVRTEFLTEPTQHFDIMMFGVGHKREYCFSIAQNFHYATTFGRVAIIGMVVRIKSASQPKCIQIQIKEGQRKHK